MKKINVMALAAMLIGGGFAFATQSSNPEPNVYFENGSWLPLDGMVEKEHYNCTLSENDCTGYSEDLESPTAPVINIQKGTFERR